MRESLLWGAVWKIQERERERERSTSHRGGGWKLVAVQREIHNAAAGRFRHPPYHPYPPFNPPITLSFALTLCARIYIFSISSRRRALSSRPVLRGYKTCDKEESPASREWRSDSASLACDIAYPRSITHKQEREATLIYAREKA